MDRITDHLSAQNLIPDLPLHSVTVLWIQYLRKILTVSEISPESALLVFWLWTLDDHVLDCMIINVAHMVRASYLQFLVVVPTRSSIILRLFFILPHLLSIISSRQMTNRWSVARTIWHHKMTMADSYHHFQATEPIPYRIDRSLLCTRSRNGHLST